MQLLSRLTRRVIPADWRETVERDLAEERSRRPLWGVRADMWMAWQLLRIGVGLRWHRGRMAGGLNGAAVQRGDRRPVPGTDRGRPFRAALTVARDAWRALRSSPSTTAFAVLILTVAIAAATVTFSVVDAVVLRSLPVEESERLVAVTSRRATVASFVHFDAWRRQANSFESLAAGSLGPTAELATGAGAATRTWTWQTTASLFEALRVKPLHGRLFTSENEVVGRDDVALIGYRTWQEAFGGDAKTIGRSIRLVRRTSEPPVFVTIVGIMPAGFRYPLDSRADIWIPHASGSLYTPRQPTDGYLNVLGRLGEDVTLAQAQTELETITAAMLQFYARFDPEGWLPVITPLRDDLVGDHKGWMLLVLWAAGLLLFVACVNVANLMLLRAGERARALAVRASLGASPRHLATTLVVESLILSLTAAGLGVVLAFWGVDVAKAAIPPNTVFRADTIAVDLRVLTVAIITAIAAGVFFGVVPAWHAARSRPASLLGTGTSRATPGHRRWRAGFLVGEIVLVGALLVVSALFIGGFVRAVRMDLGFTREGLMAVTVDEFRGFTAPTAPLLQALRTTPGVMSVAEWTGPPAFLAQGVFAYLRLKAAEHANEPGEITVLPYGISPGFFDTAGIRLLRGRAFTEADTEAPVAIIDELTADALFFDGREPLGASVLLGSNPGTPLTVVGVVQTVRRDGPERQSGPQLFRPKPIVASRGSQFLLRTSGSASTALPAIQRSLQRALPPGTAAPQVRSIEDDFNQLTSGRRTNATIMSLFGLVVLLIGAAGVYSVMASTVAQQQRELGVRVALGATRARIMRTVLGRAAVYLTIGLAVGLAAGRALSTMFASMLFDVRPGDVSTYAIVAALLLTAGLFAALRPALKAARVDPIVTLRTE